MRDLIIKDILVLIYCCAQGFEGNPFFKVLLDTMVLRKSLYRSRHFQVVVIIVWISTTIMPTLHHLLCKIYHQSIICQAFCNLEGTSACPPQNFSGHGNNMCARYDACSHFGFMAYPIVLTRINGPSEASHKFWPIAQMLSCYPCHLGPDVPGSVPKYVVDYWM